MGRLQRHVQAACHRPACPSSRRQTLKHKMSRSISRYWQFRYSCTSEDTNQFIMIHIRMTACHRPEALRCHHYMDLLSDVENGCPWGTYELMAAAQHISNLQVQKACPSCYSSNLHSSCHRSQHTACHKPSTSLVLGSLPLHLVASAAWHSHTEVLKLTGHLVKLTQTVKPYKRIPVAKYMLLLIISVILQTFCYRASLSLILTFGTVAVQNGKHLAGLRQLAVTIPPERHCSIIGTF